MGKQKNEMKIIHRRKKEKLKVKAKALRQARVQERKKAE